jgi:hypothetical protein
MVRGPSGSTWCGVELVSNQRQGVLSRSASGPLKAGRSHFDEAHPQRLLPPPLNPFPVFRLAELDDVTDRALSYFPPKSRFACASVML